MAAERFAIRNVSLAPFDESSDTISVVAGVIEAVGSWQTLQGLFNSQTIFYDAQGATVIPGINDSHLHGYMLGRQALGIDVSPNRCPNLSDLRKQLIAESPCDGGWIRGAGWVSGVISGSGPDGSLTHRELADLALEQPIFLTDFSGHQAWCNLAALKAAGITRDSANPPGGVIVRDPSGEPTGLLLEAAVELVTKAIPLPSQQAIATALTKTSELLISAGVTSFTEPGLGPGAASLDDGTATLEVLESYKRLADAGALKQRVDIMLLFGGLGGTTVRDVVDGLDEFGPPIRPNRERKVSVAQLKVFADGIPRSRTAWMSEPYDNHQHGSLTLAGETDTERLGTLESIYREATNRNWQVGLHATGDASVRAITEVADKVPKGRALRNYIIHADLIAESDFIRIAKCGLGLNLQPGIRRMVGRNVEAILGSERFKNRLQLRRISELRIPFALSSDAPVSPADWRHIVAAAVDRSFQNDASYQDDQGLSAQVALEALTIGAAFQGHAETWKGRVAPGFVADLVVLDRKIDFEGDPWAFALAKTRAVFVGGQLEYGEL